MVFFRQLGRNVRCLKILWCVVLVFTMATLAICSGVQSYNCVFGDIRDIAAASAERETNSDLVLVKCVQSSTNRFMRIGFQLQAGSDVASDCLNE